MGLTPIALQYQAIQAILALGGTGYENHHINRQDTPETSQPNTNTTTNEMSFSRTVTPEQELLMLHLSTQKPILQPPRLQRQLHRQQPTTVSVPAQQHFSKPNFGNDYSSAYVHSKTLPQNYVQNIENVQLGYPRLQRLHALKREHTLAYSLPAVSVRVPTKFVNSFVTDLSESSAQFDVLMVHGCMSPLPYELLLNMKLDRISTKPSLVFLWCSNTEIGKGRSLLERWGFRNAEDITYLVSSQQSVHMPKDDGLGFVGNPSAGQDLFKHSTWHCLMGLRGTLRRSIDVELIHCNVDTDVIIEKTKGKRMANIVPNEIYELVENFTNMGRRIHIVPTESAELPLRPRPGWVTVGPSAFTFGEFKAENYRSRYVQPNLDEVELLRPRTPPKFK